MRFAPGVYAATLPAGTIKIDASTETKAAQLEKWARDNKPRSVGRVGGTMPQYSQTLRPVSGADGPWWVISRNPDGTDFNVTLGLASPGAALDQAKTDGTAILSAASATPKNIDIFTTF